MVCINTYAQQKINISGQVKDDKNQAVVFADILITTADKNEHILQFTITDSNGNFALEYRPSVQKMKVKVASMGFKKKTQVLNVDPDKQSYTFTFVMDDKMENLKEVEVKAKPKVRVNKDTTVFNLQNIANGTEEVVEDILSKCPGMELEGNGKFKFKGKDVSTVLLEDDDLFGGAYTIGTKNIKAQDIQGVETIENYTINPLMQGVGISNKVAVRLKFKKGISIANNMELGYGYKERYYANHTGIVIAKKIKAFNLFNYNNLGVNVGKWHFNPMGHLRMLGTDPATNATRNSTFLESSSVSSLFKAQQSERNNAFFGSLNLVPHITKTLKVRANLNFFSDRSLQQQSFKSIITTDPDKPIVIEQKDQRRYKPRFFNADMHLEKYFGKNSVENILQFSRLRNTTDQEGIINGEDQELVSRTKDFYLFNSTKLLRRLNEDNAIQLQADIAFHETPERLYVMPGINFDNNQLEKGISNLQDITSKKESAQLKAYYYHKINKNNRINLHLGMSYHNKSLQSQLMQNETNERYNNNLDIKTMAPYLSVSYQLKYNGLEVSPTLSTNLYNYSYKENGGDAKEGGKLLLNTALNLRYLLNRNHELNVGVSRIQSQPDEKNLFTDFVMVSNRSLQNNLLSFDAITRRNLELSYNYRDMLNDYSLGISFSYNDKDKAMQSALNISQDVSYTTYFLGNKGAKSYNYNGHFRKFVSALNSTIRFNSSYSLGEYYNRVNSIELRKNESKSWGHNFNIETNFIGDFIFGNGISYSRSEFSSKERNKIVNEHVNASLMAIYKPNNQFIARVDYNYSIPSFSNRENYTQKLDAFIQFYNKTRSMSFKIEGRNLLDQRSMDFISNTDYAKIVTNKSLQDRYFLFSVGFRF